MLLDANLDGALSNEELQRVMNFVKVRKRKMGQRPKLMHPEG